MDHTEFAASTQLQEPHASTAEVDESYSRLREIALELRGLGTRLEDLELAILDSLIPHFDCERGALIYATGVTAGSRPTDLAFEIKWSRIVSSRDPATGAVKLLHQDNPEFSIRHRLIKEVLRAGKPLLVKDYVGEPVLDGLDVQHSVICSPFELAGDKLGVIYLARSVGEPSFLDDDLRRMEDFSLVCLPVLQQAHLSAEIVRLEAGGTPADSTAGGSVMSAASDVDEGPLVELDGELPSYHGLIGSSPLLKEVFELVEKIKDTDFNVCIVGESGTGKELLARAVHAAGVRRDEAFVSENCGAISETLLESELFGHVKGAFTGADDNHEGLFQQANGGTLFLDEIGDMSEGMQRKLLRALQEGTIRPIGSKSIVHVDVRVLCASNRDLRLLVENGTFRADLYYRLNVISIQLPPLRDRMEDIPLLVTHFLDEIAREEGVERRFSESAMRALASYNWPGNVRELGNVLRRLLITGRRRVVTRKEVLPLLSNGPAQSYVGEGADELDNQISLRIPRRTTFNEIIAECEKAVLSNALKENRWNKSRVTKVLRIPRQSLYNKIAKYGLKRNSDWDKLTF